MAMDTGSRLEGSYPSWPSKGELKLPVLEKHAHESSGGTGCADRLHEIFEIWVCIKASWICRNAFFRPPPPIPMFKIRSMVHRASQGVGKKQALVLLLFVSGVH